MSEDLSLRYTNKEVVQLVVGNTYHREPLHAHQLQWMAHWTQASSSSSSLCQKHCGATKAITESAQPNMRNTLNLFGSKSSQKPHASSSSCENFSYNFQNSHATAPEWTHFPMLDINRKIETIMAANKRNGLGIMAARMNRHLKESASEGIQYQRPRQNVARIDKKTRTSESVEASSSHESHQSNMKPDAQNDDGSDHFNSGLALKEHFTKAKFTYLKHELCYGSNHSTIMVSEMKTDDFCFENSGNRLKGLGNVVESVHIGNKTTLGLRKSDKLSNYATINRKDPPKFAEKHDLVTRGVDSNLCNNDQTIRCSPVSTNVKGSAFFEKFTLSLDQHGQRDKKFVSLVRPTNSEVGIEAADVQAMEKENEFLVKTDHMQTDVSKSPEVASSFGSQKIPDDLVHPSLKISEMVGTNASRAESVAPPTPPTESAERENCKWVKRLRANPLDAPPLAAKRFKIGDSSSGGEMQNLLARVVNYNRSISDLPDRQRLGKKTLFPENSEIFQGDSAKLLPWIRRWCRTSQETGSSAPVLCEPENPKVLPERFEAKQIPSLAAMALVGKQVTNARPCEFRRRGSTTVWNI